MQGVFVLLFWTGNRRDVPRFGSGRPRIRTTLFRGEQKAPENATHPKTQVIDRFQNLRFQVCCVFGSSLFRSKRAPKHTRKRRFWERSVTCVFGCVAFSGAFCACQIVYARKLWADFSFPELLKVSPGSPYLQLLVGCGPRS